MEKINKELRIKITKSIEKYLLDYPQSKLSDRESVIEIMEEIELNPEIPLNLRVELMSDRFGTDFWLQATFYSKVIGLAIVFDWDWEDSYESVNEMVEHICETEQEIVSLENRITLDTYASNKQQ